MMSDGVCAFAARLLVKNNRINMIDAYLRMVGTKIIFFAGFDRFFGAF
jgi:hypothetical protein